MRAILVKTDGTVQDLGFPIPRKPDMATTGGFSLDELRKLLDCDMVEHLDLVKGVHLWCDEEGRLKDENNVNKVATEYFHKAYPDDKYNWAPFGGKYDIIGNAVIIDNTKEGWL